MMQASRYKVVLCIPTLNPGPLALKMVEALGRQSLYPEAILIVDSSSTDGSVDGYKVLQGVEVETIDRKTFDHGRARNLVFSRYDAEIYVFLTQDAIPVNEFAIELLVGVLTKSRDYGVAYGRQVPAVDASLMAQHARLYNYPLGESEIPKGIDDIPRLGLKTAFCSNSFSAYRKEAVAQIGLFSVPTLFAEDSIAAARMLQHGWKVVYVPQAEVVHSHDYSPIQDFKRYFDVGAFHAMNDWYMALLGGAQGEGVAFVKSELAFLRSRSLPWSAIRVIYRNAVRWCGYRVGRLHRFLPHALKIRISTNRAYWLGMRSMRER